MRLIILYILLVGAMLAGLLEILHVGEKMKAPIDVSGNWTIEKQTQSKIQSNCMNIIFSKHNAGFNIEQSGKFLELTFSDASNTKLEGELENDSLKFIGTVPSGSGISKSCGNKLQVELKLKLIKKASSPEEFIGVWTTPNCNICRNVIFSAVKQTN